MQPGSLVFREASADGTDELVFAVGTDESYQQASDTPAAAFAVTYNSGVNGDLGFDFQDASICTSHDNAFRAAVSQPMCVA